MNNAEPSKAISELVARGRFVDLIKTQYNYFGFEGRKARGRTPLVQSTILLGVHLFEDDVLQLEELAGTAIGGGSQRSAAARLCFDLVWRLVRKHTPANGSLVEGFIAAHNALTKDSIS